MQDGAARYSGHRGPDETGRLKVDSQGEERAPSPILSPPSSPLRERARHDRSSGPGGPIADDKQRPDIRFRSTDADDKENAPDTTSPINIPLSQTRIDNTPGLETTSLNSLFHIPASRFLVGRSHYSAQPITVEYYITEKIVSGEHGERVKKQATTIRSIGDYQVIRTIGSGSTGKVKLAVNIRNQQKVAIKIISRRYISDSSKNSKETPASRKRRILREAAILNLVHHPNIVRLYDLYVTEEYFCMVFEYVEGGQMLDYIISHGRLKENVARRFFRQLLSAVSYCHRNGIVHRDLKIENVLIDSKGDVKLVDFGLSNFYDPNEKLMTFCGSLYFAAPELLRGITYTGPEVDIWSLGIILYVLVCGKVPFDDKSLSALHEKIKGGKFVSPTHLTAECSNLLTVMIDVDPRRRVQMSEIIAHPWTVFDGETVANYALERTPLEEIDADIESFLVREFPYQFEAEDIRRVLRTGFCNWSVQLQHPIMALYFLAAQKQQRQLEAPLLQSLPLRSVHLATETNEGALATGVAAHSEGASSRLEPTATVTPSVPLRKRTESLPSGHAAASLMTPVAKSKRSVSLQSSPHNLKIASEETDRRMEVVLERDEAIANEDMKVRNVYLRGIFSVNTTSTKSAHQIRDIVIRTLIHLHPSIIFLDRESYFICEYQVSVSASTAVPSTSNGALLEEDDVEEARADDDMDISQLDLRDEGREDSKTSQSEQLTFGAAPFRSIRFEIHIVRVALLGLHGVQFKRISGDFSVYKNLCAQLVSEFNL